MSNPFISVCMIVKNEEEVLPRCLAAMSGLYDELIIVDTGSTDSTVDIALAHSATVLHFDWQSPGNKGAARNFGIDAASGEWIVVVDADEVVRDPLALRQLLIKQANDDAISILFHNYAGEKITLSWQQIRAFKRGKYAYKYREHEMPFPLIPEPYVGISDAVFEHRAPSDRATGKSAPMMARLALDVEENPGDPHPLYFYHRECVTQGEYTKAIELGQQYLDLTKNGGFIQADIYGNLAIAHQRLGAVSQARRYLHLAASEEPDRREWWYRLGALHFECKEWNVALAMLRAAAEIAPNQSRQWEPMTTTYIYQLIDRCQQELAHTFAHSHEHAHTH